MNVVVSVYRLYTVKGEKGPQVLTYLSELSTVKTLRTTHEIALDDKSVLGKFRAEHEQRVKAGLAKSIDEIEHWLNVSLVVPSRKELRGKSVRKTSTGLPIVHWRTRLPRRTDGDRPAKYVNPQALEPGTTYRLSRATPMWRSFAPADTDRTDKPRYVPAGGRITVLALRSRNIVPWYRVRAKSGKGERIGEGWIDSSALLGQDVEAMD
jgi:hypothetical protein